jgi:hypothetical protein
MRKLIAALATATILTVGSIGWKAEAAIVTGVDSLPPLIKTYGSYRDPYYRPYRDPYYRPYRHGYGYNDYGYWRYGNYPVSPLEVPPDPDGNCGWPCGGDQE